MTEPRCVGMTELFSGRANQETVRARGLVQAYKLTKGYAHFIVVDFRPLVHVCMRVLRLVSTRQTQSDSARALARRQG